MMIFLIPLGMGLQPNPPVALFNRARASHRALTAGAATVVVKTSGRLAGNDATYQLVWQRPRRASVTIDKPASGIQASSRRRFVLEGNKMTGIDLFANEYMSSGVPVEYKTLMRGMAYGTGALDDSARFLLDVPYFEKFLDLMSLTSGWSTQRVGKTTIAVRQEGKDRNELIFSDQTGLLVGMKSSAGLNISLAYKAATPISSAIPKGAEKVTVFRERWVPPKYGSRAAQTAAEAAIRAYWGVRKLNYTVSGSAGTYQVTYDRGSFTQVRGNVTTKYANRVAFVSWKNPTLSRQVAGDRTQILDQFKKWSVDVEPTLLRMWSGTNPMQTYFRPRASVTLVASIRSGQNPVDVFEIREGLSRMTVEIRRDSRLLSKVTSEQLDAAGNTVLRSESNFTYRR